MDTLISKKLKEILSNKEATDLLFSKLLRADSNPQKPFDVSLDKKRTYKVTIDNYLDNEK